jgi:diadenosine tetraphosphate (Ap4A) HIT family hydrolase
MSGKPAVSTFQLHPRLANDCIDLGRFDLCRVLLMNERTHPWLILVPQRAGVSEICELSETDQKTLIVESSRIARAMLALFRPDKLSIAAIGNLVPQLHIHHVARFRTDPAWPGTVWGRAPMEAYDAAELAALRPRLREALPELWPPA